MRDRVIDRIMIDITAALSQKDAEAVHGILVKHLSNVEFTETLPATVDNTNSYLIDLYKATRGRRLSAKTLRAYLYTLERFEDVVHKNFIHADSLDVERFLAVMQTTNRETSLNNHLRNLSAFYTWLRKERFLQFSPCDNIEPYKEPEKPVEHLSSTEMDSVRRACHTSRQRALIEFLRCTACRAGELGGINVEDIKENKLLVYGEKRKAYRTVCIDDLAASWLERYLRGRKKGPLFPKKGGGRIDGGCVYKSVHYIGKKAKLEKSLYPHLFRKSTATNIVKRGGTIRDAGDYLGHKDRTVTGSHYVFKDDEYIENIFKRYVAAV